MLADSCPPLDLASLGLFSPPYYLEQIYLHGWEACSWLGHLYVFRFVPDDVLMPRGLVFLCRILAFHVHEILFPFNPSRS